MLVTWEVEESAGELGLKLVLRSGLDELSIAPQHLKNTYS